MGEQNKIVSGTQIHKVGSSYRTFYTRILRASILKQGNPLFYTNELDENEII